MANPNLFLRLAIRCLRWILIFGDEIWIYLELSLDLWMDISYCKCLLLKFHSWKMSNVRNCCNYINVIFSPNCWRFILKAIWLAIPNVTHRMTCDECSKRMKFCFSSIKLHNFWVGNRWGLVARASILDLLKESYRKFEASRTPYAQWRRTLSKPFRDQILLSPYFLLPKFWSPLLGRLA